MADRKQERQLLGYLLGALEDSERARIDRQLAGDAALRENLARAEENLGPLRAASRTFRAPEGLAARTCRRVFAYAEALAGRSEGARTVTRTPRQRARTMSPAAVPPSSTATWGWSDLVVALGVFLAVTCSIFPALQRSRLNSRLVACQGNMREIGLTHAQYHDLHSEAVGSGMAGGGAAMAGLPMASFLNQVGNAGLLAPRPDSRAPHSRTGLFCRRAGAVVGHDGFTGDVRGQNLLFLDGRVVFLATGPTVDPSSDRLDDGDPLTSAWPNRPDAPANGSGDFAPIVPVNRPLP